MHSPAIPFLIALLIALLAGGPAIKALKARNSVQPISPDAPEKHRLKHGTPTMGGLFFGAAVLITCLPFAFASVEIRRAISPLCIIFIAGMLIGFLDDLGKAQKKENKAGLSERVKLGMQLLASAGFVMMLYANASPADATKITIGYTFDLGIFYWPLAFLFIAFFGNAVNFTDGLDGLASGVTVIVSLTLALFSSLSFHPEVAPFFLAVAGGCAGFLYWNAYPARVFMGDTGSQALGMGLAAAALAAKMEILFLIIGAVYLAEIGSMMLQRYVFKYRRIRFGIDYAKANRVFRRAPLHHHFEELGWHETQVVTRFYVFALIAAGAGGLLAPYLIRGLD